MDNVCKFLFKSPSSLVLGLGASKDIGHYTKKLSVEKVLVIVDSILLKFGIATAIKESLDSYKIQYEFFSNIQPEPPVENANDALILYKSTGCNGVIGIGGGSPIDVAKAVAMMATNPGKFEDYVGIGKVPNKCAPLLLVPTTSGTGSEVSNFSILIVNGSKAGVVDQNIVADVALVDPMLTISIPRNITAATGLDAFCHHIESYISTNASPISDMICLEGIRIIGKYLRKAVGNGDNVTARYWMSYASTLGGYVMNLTDGAAANHGLAFALGAKYHVSHGLANAVMLPHVFQTVGVADLEKVRNIGNALDLNLIGNTDRQALNLVVDEITKLTDDVGCYIPLKEFGVNEKDLDGLVDEVVKTQKRVMGHSTYQLTPAEIRNIFAKAMQ